jgi:hypothetical protein
VDLEGADQARRHPAALGTWTVFFAGGGPWDGAVARRLDPIRLQLISVVDEDGEEGYQVYELRTADHEEKVLVMGYRGENWDGLGL